MSTAEVNAAAKWKLPKADKALFEKNFIRQAVCELRFPTLFELVEAGKKPPASFTKALRKDYPNYAIGVHLDPSSDSPTNTHTFKSKGNQWTVTLRAAAVVLETNRYTSFEEFRLRLSKVISAAAEVIDSDFYTRIGLRYINAVPYDATTIGSWVNPALVSTITDGLFGAPEEHYCRMRGETPIGGFFFQHGIGPTMGINTSLIDKKCYSLDFDLYSEDVEANNALSVVDELHDYEFSLFSWSLGPKAKEDLGPSKLKAKAKNV